MLHSYPVKGKKLSFKLLAKWLAIRETSVHTALMNTKRTTRTPMLKVGDRLCYHGSSWAREIKGVMEWCNANDVAEVIERHEAQPPIPWLVILGERDKGLPAYVVAQFPNGVKIAVEGADLQRGRWTKVQA